MQPLTILGLGLLLGLRHAADPDHVVAIGAIAARTQRLWPATRLGIVWGLGHTVTLSVVAGGIILFDWVVPPRLGLGMEFCVGVALVTLGAANVRSHAHSHDSGASDVSGPRRAFFVGLVHGLAGSAAVALLVVSTVRDAFLTGAYLLTFGLGTLVGMTIITTGLALPLATMTSRWNGGHRLIRVATGVISVAMGLWLVYDIGWNGGLFLATVNWTPR
jgi:high-affinity nickel-transport protein